MFFLAALVPFCIATDPIITSPGIPSPIYWVMVSVIGIFCAFAVVGSMAIVSMIFILQGGSSNFLSDISYWMKFQLVGFEILNQGKWIICTVVVSSVLATVGLG